MFEIWERPLDARVVEAAVADAGNGAVVTFAGIVRNNSRGQAVDHLEYDVYRPLAEKAFREIGDEIRQRWGLPCAILHRVGRLEIGEASVIIAVAAPHRKDAFVACEYAIDRLKEKAPIWKREITPTGEYWIEGDTPVG